MICIGVDPALGGGFALMVCDLSEKLTILDCQVTYDLSKTEEMIAQIGEMARKYRPSLVIIEIDAQQKGLGNDDRLKTLGQMCGFTIKPHLTKGQKMDHVFGVAAMDRSFKDGLVRIPYGDDITQSRMAPLLTQLRAWRPDIQTKALTQDLVMALWFVHLYWKRMSRIHQDTAAPAWRPSWIGNEAALRQRIA